MADGTVEILMKHKFQELRREYNNIIDVSFENTSNQTYTAIAKHFEIEMGTVRDLIKTYRGDVTVIRIGTALVVNIK